MRYLKTLFISVTLIKFYFHIPKHHYFLLLVMSGNVQILRHIEFYLRTVAAANWNYLMVEVRSMFFKQA